MTAGWRDVRVIEVQEGVVGPRRALVTVAGEVDHLTCALLDSALVRASGARPLAMAVDLRQVPFLNGMLVERDGITADRALDVLTAASRAREQSVAEELIRTHLH